jgi:MFS family permease
MSDAAAPRSLLSFEFVGLCSVSFLAFCNVTVFYDLFGYLSTLGIPAELRGLVIGGYSLTAMALYLLASPLLTFGNAPRTMFLGLAVLVASGLSYLHVHSFWGLLSLRMLNGAGQFCVGAGAMALLVAVIPHERSGQAFGIYSVAILVAYACVPAVMDALAPLVRTPPHGYAAATLSLLPAAWIVWRIRRRHRGELRSAPARARRPTWSEIRVDAARLPVLLLVLLNVGYFANWSSVFFLFKGFAEQQGIGNVGAFFSVQIGLMIAIRLGAGRLFDTVDKAWLVGASFAIIAAGHLALDRLPGVWAVPFLGALFGIGLGAGYPSLSGLMFEISPPRFRALGANLMLFAVQAGFFLGPVVGGALVARHGYHGYFTASTAMALAAAVVSLVLARQRRATAPRREARPGAAGDPPGRS